MDIQTLAELTVFSFGELNSSVLGRVVRPHRQNVCFGVGLVGHRFSFRTKKSTTWPVAGLYMMARSSAIDNPALFADVDRYFYGLPSNPCRNRRQVLEAYCQYLMEQLYPRR
jgi:hypothetical protein